MNRLDIAIRRYEQIVQESAPDALDRPNPKLFVWRDEELQAALDEYMEMPNFRAEAMWPLWALKSESNTDERKLIDRTSTAIRDCAMALMQLAKKRLVQRKLEAVSNRRQASLDMATAQSSSSSPESPDAVSKSKNIDHDALAIMANSSLELVNTADYFWPAPINGESVEWYEIAVSNPDLLIPGNLVVRRLLQRVASSIGTLWRYRSKLLNALRGITAEYAAESSELQRRWEELISLEVEVKTVFGGEETRLRDACVSLTQVYAAVRPKLDLGWLGLDAGSQADKLRNVSSLMCFNCQQFFDRIAAALIELRRLPGGADPTQVRIRHAIEEGGLVVDKQSREVHWEGVLIRHTDGKLWSETEWRILEALVRRARVRGSITTCDVYGDMDIGPKAIRTAMYRLKLMLPASLRKHVVAAEKECYRLTLERENIQFFE